MFQYHPYFLYTLNTLMVMMGLIPYDLPESEVEYL